MLKSILKVRGS